MAPALGNAPRSTDRESVVLLLHHAGEGIGKCGGAPRSRTLDTWEGAAVFKTAPSTDRTRSLCESGSSPWHRTKLTPLNRRAAHSVRWEDPGAPGRILACIIPLRRRVPDTFGHGSDLESGRAPRCCPECLLVPSEADCCLPRARSMNVVLRKWRPVRALLPRPSARQAAALRS